MLLVLDENTWEDYPWRQEQDRRVLERITTLLADVQRNRNEGVGKPDALKDEVRIAACSCHYG